MLKNVSTQWPNGRHNKQTGDPTNIEQSHMTDRLSIWARTSEN